MSHTPRWASHAYASRRSGWWHGNRSHRWRDLRDRQWGRRAGAYGCWRTTPEGRRLQSILQAAVDRDGFQITPPQER